MLLLGTAFADGARERVPGYVTDLEGTILRSLFGECVHSNYWKPENAVVGGCDNVMLKAPVDID